MTPDQQQKIITIAEYDGWVEAHDSYYPKGTYKRKINDSDWKHENIHFLEYDKIDNLLMPVARKIYKEMADLERSWAIEKSKITFQSDEYSELYNNWCRLHAKIQALHYFFTKPTAELFTAVYNAIELLNTFKAAQ